jgi:uncharacterized protein DUF4145
METSKTIVAPCSSCLTKTRHTVLHEVSRRTEDGEYDEWYGLLECAGCATISTVHQARYLGDGTVEHVFYPPPMARRMPKWASFMMLDGEAEGVVQDLLKEIHQAMQGDMRRLAAMGMRALLEHVMIAKVGDHGSFTSHLDAFEKGGYISLIRRDAIRTILDVGDAATHRSFKPTMDELNTALDVVEGVLAAIYDHSERTAKLGDRVPPRPPRKPKKPPKT